MIIHGMHERKDEEEKSKNKTKSKSKSKLKSKSKSKSIIIKISSSLSISLFLSATNVHTVSSFKVCPGTFLGGMFPAPAKNLQSLDSVGEKRIFFFRRRHIFFLLIRTLLIENIFQFLKLDDHIKTK